MSPRITFEHELEELKQSVTEMGIRVENLYDNLFRALDGKDTETVETILKSDRIINDMQRSIEAECLSLITKQHPIASDLRMVTAVLKVVTDIERIGDHISDMAELLIRLGLPKLSDFSASLPEMAEATKRMVQIAVNAFVSCNQEAAKDAIEQDDIVDELFNRVKEDLIYLLKEEKKHADDCVDVLMITKYLEKIGDHAVNIGEWEIFRETGIIKDKVLL